MTFNDRDYIGLFSILRNVNKRKKKKEPEDVLPCRKHRNIRWLHTKPICMSSTAPVLLQHIITCGNMGPSFAIVVRE